MQNLGVSSEIGALKKMIIHSPDMGFNQVVPNESEEWLFDDIVHLKDLRKQEYDLYVKLLLYFLDREKVADKIQEIDHPDAKREFYKPNHPQYFNSKNVMDTQCLLADILEKEHVKLQLVASIATVENLTYQRQKELLQLSSQQLALSLISGVLPNDKVVFVPIPNFIFTRDIATVVNDHIVLTQFNRLIRKRESLLAKYVFYHHEYFSEYQNRIIEVSENRNYKLSSKQTVSIEGGDIMMVAPNHVVIGCSERSTPLGVDKLMSQLFDKNLVEKISVIFLPKIRNYMHIDTVFTQVKKDTWVILAQLGKELETARYINLGNTNHQLHIEQFNKDGKIKEYDKLENLLSDISCLDWGASDTSFIYSGGGDYLSGRREQWTDACNLLALREGVVIGYDRNTKTDREFQEKGFSVIRAEDLLQEFEQEIKHPDTLKDTLITLPSAELSRTRGGTHCMSLPILRSPLN